MTNPVTLPVSQKGPRAGRSLTVSVYEMLRSEILSGHLAPGEKVSTSQVAKRYRSSLSSVREALSRLHSDKLVTFEERKGFRVSDMSLDDLWDLVKMRIMVETYALRESILAGDTDWEIRVMGAFLKLSRMPKRIGENHCLNDEWMLCHREFHSALVSACASPWVHRVRTMLHEQLERYHRLMLVHYLDHGLDAEIEVQHQKLMDLAVKKDESAAVALLAEHLMATPRHIATVGSKKELPPAIRKITSKADFAIFSTAVGNGIGDYHSVTST